jgi:predicted enzyme related to lactoylglutathione lyase
MLIKKIGLSIIAVKDIDKAYDFYENIIGLNIINDENPDYFEASAEDEYIIAIGKESKEEGFVAGKNPPINFMVNDIEKAKDELENKGVKFLSNIISLDGNIKLALFEDPDRNKFFLIQGN